MAPWKHGYLALTRQLVEGRKASNLTQQRVADRLQMSRRKFQRCEGAETNPSLIQLFVWADLVGVDITSARRGA